MNVCTRVCIYTCEYGNIYVSMLIKHYTYRTIHLKTAEGRETKALDFLLLQQQARARTV